MKKLSNKVYGSPVNEALKLSINDESTQRIEKAKSVIASVANMLNNPGTIDPSFNSTLMSMVDGDITLESYLGTGLGGGTLVLAYKMPYHDEDTLLYVESRAPRIKVKGVRKVSPTIKADGNFYLTLYFEDDIAALIRAL